VSELQERLQKSIAKHKTKTQSHQKPLSDHNQNLHRCLHCWCLYKFHVILGILPPNYR